MGPSARRLPAFAASFLASQLGSAAEAINFLLCDAFLHGFARKPQSGQETPRAHDRLHEREPH